MVNKIIQQSSEFSSPKALANVLLYKLNRFFFVLYPCQFMLIKIIDIPYFSFWKDIIIVLNIIYFLANPSSDRFLFRYIILILISLIIDSLLDRLYFEYLYWFILGLPVYNYFKNTTKEHWDFDIIFITVFMCFGAFWIYFFELSGRYGYFFVPEKEGFTLERGESFRMRYCFISPMALSQYTWFTLILLNTNSRINKTFKLIGSVLLLYVLVICNTRAGILLFSISCCIFLYNYFLKLSKFGVVLIIILTSIGIFYQMFDNIGKSSETSASDALRLLRFNAGIESIKSNWLVGLGGERYSPRSKFFIEVSNFENSWLALIYSFGITGMIIFSLIMSKLLNNISKPIPQFLFFSVPWIVYSLIFPILQEAIPVYITWFIVSLSINTKKFHLIFE